ncbi:MAG: hypothetical protein DI556_22240 [Rhodovulum sulfidophilum]|uniref:Solute-binding protein family 5 domain-containing protein n=1 Tax=Rhodovulum sulfidophilum TaxID=35806 RepID=A0A2W5MZY0_RHOSU|nr:MAG: hypothetical protein DI556_22240 [Rhodovulum sulfidophilum]
MAIQRRTGPEMTRQQFLRAAGATGLAGAFGGTLPWAGVERAMAQEAAPRRGGILNFNFTGDPPSFDPLGGDSTQIMSCIAPCYNNLIRVDPENPDAIIGDLAERWDVSPDATVYTFHLVRNARFHDGEPLTAADAKYTFDLVRDPPAGVAAARSASLANVASIETPDEYTVVFNLSVPSPSFLVTMAGAWMMVLPKHILEAGGSLSDQIVGSGPYRLKERVQGVSVELERNPDYHVPDRPFLDGIKGYVIPDLGTTVNYMLAGQLQLYVVVRGEAINQLRGDDNVVLDEITSTSCIGLVLNTRRAPFDDPAVRKATTLAIDRAEILRIAQSGGGVLGGAVMPGPWQLPEEDLLAIPGYGLDVEANRAEAKRLLAEAGLAEGPEIRLMVRRIPLFDPVGVVLKSQLEKVGFRVVLDVQETAAFLDRMRKHDFDAAPTAVEYTANDPDAMFPSRQTCDGALNFAGTCDPGLDELIAQQSVTVDEAERRELVHRIERAVLESHGVVYMYWQNRVMGLSTRLHGMRVHPNIDNNLRMQDVWLSA